jgi:microcystin-dependent protein
MADVIEHAIIQNQHLHEPKGISTASKGQVYVADGSGSGAWDTISILEVSSAYPIGSVMPYAGTVPPTGWLFCYGQVVGRAEYPALFSVIGVNYGIGDGSTTFAIPDCRGRVPIGKDNMGGSSANRITTAGSGINGSIIGSGGGVEGVLLTADNIPPLTGSAQSAGSHTHSLTNGTNKYQHFGSGVSGVFSADANVDDNYSGISLDEAGAHTHTVIVNAGVTPVAHNNLQPTIVLNMIIYTGRA